jgi:hypothetical protein
MKKKVYSIILFNFSDKIVENFIISNYENYIIENQFSKKGGVCHPEIIIYGENEKLRIYESFENQLKKLCQKGIYTDDFFVSSGNPIQLKEDYYVVNNEEKQKIDLKLISTTSVFNEQKIKIDKQTEFLISKIYPKTFIMINFYG